jgi:hypothetical protein
VNQTMYNYRHHPRRTKDPSQASLFIIPFDTFLSYPTLQEQRTAHIEPSCEPPYGHPTTTTITKSNYENATSSFSTSSSSQVPSSFPFQMTPTSMVPPTHRRRSTAVMNVILKSKWWKKNKGKDHLLISPW